MLCGFLLLSSVVSLLLTVNSIPFHTSQTSFSKVVPPSFMELGIGELVSIYSELCQFGSPPPVIDADDLLQDPKVNL
jgi:hypothetical protein